PCRPLPPGAAMTALYRVQDLRVDMQLPGGPIPFGRAPRLNILDGISFELHAGETFGLVGESGSGKTTLARAMLGLVPATGTLRFRGAPLTEAGLRRGTAMMFQDPVASLSPRMQVGTAITEP